MTYTTAQSSLSDRTPDFTPDVHWRDIQDTAKTWSIATLRLKLQPGEDHQSLETAHFPSTHDTQLGTCASSQVYEQVQQHELSQLRSAIASHLAADGFGLLSEQPSARKGMTPGPDATSFPPTCASIESKVDTCNVFESAVRDSSHTLMQPDSPSATIGDNPLQGQAPSISFPYSCIMSGLYHYPHDVAHNACVSSSTDEAVTNAAGNNVDLLNYIIAFNHSGLLDPPGQEQGLQADEATKAYCSMGISPSTYTPQYPLPSHASFFCPVLPADYGPNEARGSPGVSGFTNEGGHDVVGLASFVPTIAASLFGTYGSVSNVDAISLHHESGDSCQGLDYVLESASGSRVSATREDRSCSLSSSSHEDLQATNLTAPNVFGVDVALPSKSFSPTSSGPILASIPAQNGANQSSYSTATATTSPRTRSATAIGLGTGRSSEALLNMKEGEQSLKERRHMLSRQRKESKIKTRMMRRASEQVAQAATLRIAPKEKAVLSTHCLDGAGSICLENKRGACPPLVRKDQVGSIPLCMDGSARDEHFRSIGVETSGEDTQSLTLSYCSTSPKLLTRNTPNGPRMYAAISRTTRPPLRCSPRPKKVCPYPNCSNVHGFSGDHELRRHIVREHSNRRPVWVLVDISPDRSMLRNCKKCQAGKRYNAVYNAAEHLRKHLLGARKCKHQTRAQRTVLPIKELQPWMKMYEEINVGDGKSVLVEIGAKVDQLDGSEHDSRQFSKSRAKNQRTDDTPSSIGRKMVPPAPASHSSVSSPSLSFSSASSCRSLASPRTCNLASPAINAGGELNQGFPTVMSSYAKLPLVHPPRSSDVHARMLPSQESVVDTLSMDALTDLASRMVERDDGGMGGSASTTHTAAIPVSTHDDGLSQACSQA